MEIAYTEEQQALKSELRAYYQNLLTPEVEQELSQSHGIGPAVRRVVRQMGGTAGSASAGPRSGADRAALRLSSSSSSTSRCAAGRPSRC